MIVSFDFDGVGYWFGHSVRNYLNSIGIDVAEPTDEFCSSWTFHEAWGMDRKEFNSHCHDGVDAGIIFAPGDRLTRPGFFETVKRVKEMGHTVLGKTHRYQGSPGNAERNTYNWLGDNIIYFDDVLFVEDKTQGPHSDMMVEDNLANYDDLVAVGTNAYLINRPWNHLPEGDARNRINDIVDFGDAVEQITKQGFHDLAFA